MVAGSNESMPTACIAVSPEGVVRYWPNIAYEASTAEISAELKGEECASVTNFQVSMLSKAYLKIFSSVIWLFFCFCCCLFFLFFFANLRSWVSLCSDALRGDLSIVVNGVQVQNFNVEVFSDC